MNIYKQRGKKADPLPPASLREKGFVSGSGGWVPGMRSGFFPVRCNASELEHLGHCSRLAASQEWLTPVMLS